MVQLQSYFRWFGRVWTSDFLWYYSWMNPFWLGLCNKISKYMVNKKNDFTCRKLIKKLWRKENKIRNQIDALICSEKDSSESDDIKVNLLSKKKRIISHVNRLWKFIFIEFVFISTRFDYTCAVKFLRIHPKILSLPSDFSLWKPGW